MAPWRTFPARRLHRHQHEPPGRAGRRLLQQARHGEQWIKEGKGAIHWTRLSCRTFAANAVRLQLHALAYNLGNFLRTLATPEPIKDWSLTSLKEKLIKIGAKVVSHGRYVAFQMAEVAIPRQMFHEILRLIAELRPQPPPRQHEAYDRYPFHSNRREERATIASEKVMGNSKDISGSFAHLLALDVEATCDDGLTLPRQEMETIEIGAIIVSAECEVVDEFQTFIKPIRHARLTPFCTRLTGIRQVDVDGAPYFYGAMEAFKAWFSKYPGLILWGSWGGYDKRQLEQDCAFNGLSSSVYLPGRHVNLKEACKEALGLSTKPGYIRRSISSGWNFPGPTTGGIPLTVRNIGRLLPYILGKAKPPPQRVISH